MADGNMKSMSSKRVVQIEEVALQLDKRDLAEMIEAEDPTNTVDPRDLTIVVSTTSADGSEPKAYGAAQLLEMARRLNENIPEDAEVVVSLRWKRESDAPQLPPPPPPQQYAPAYAQQPAPPPGRIIQPQEAGQCATCGGVPAAQGPTPDCHDQNGCERVRAQKGDLPIPKATTPGNAPQVGVGYGAPAKGANILINRETGERAFADAKGQPYGKHDDYER